MGLRVPSRKAKVKEDIGHWTRRHKGEHGEFEEDGEEGKPASTSCFEPRSLIVGGSEIMDDCGGLERSCR